jgi:hypothetical protein
MKIKLLSLTIIMLLIVSLGTSVYATNDTFERSNNTNPIISIETIAAPKFADQYVVKNAEEYIDIISDEISGNKKFSIGKGYTIFKLDNNNVIPSNVFFYPIASEDKIVGTIAIHINSSDVQGVTISKGLSKHINNLSKNKTYRIVAVDGAVYAYNNGDWIFLKRVESNEFEKDIDLKSLSFSNANKYQSVNFKLPLVDNIALPTTKATHEYELIGVDMVTQGSYKWCGAATCAMIINQRDNASHTARSVTIDIHGSAINEGITYSEAKSWMQGEGYYSSHSSSIRTYSQVKVDIDAGRPLYGRFYRYVSKGKAYHAMCMDGYKQYTSGNQYYHIVNPQDDSGWSILNSTFEYTTDVGRTYTWFAAIYNI